MTVGVTDDNFNYDLDGNYRQAGVNGAIVIPDHVKLPKYAEIANLALGNRT